MKIKDFIIDIRINLTKGEVRLLSKTGITKDVVIDYILDYFKVDMEDINNNKRDDTVMAKQFIIYWLTYLFDTSSKDLKKLLNYAEDSSIITTTLIKLKDLLIDQKDEKYVRPHNNHSRFLQGFGYKTDIIEFNKSSHE